MTATPNKLVGLFISVGLEIRQELAKVGAGHQEFTSFRNRGQQLATGTQRHSLR